MQDPIDYQTDEQRAALLAGVAAVERIDTMIHQLEYLKAVQLASLTRLASRIAHDEGHADHGELVHRAVEAEVSVATRTGHAATAHRMGHADQLLGHYPAVAEAFAAGRLSHRHTEVIVDAGQIVAGGGEARSAYEAAILPVALSSTAHQLRTHARRVAEHFAGRSIDERHREARERRCVRVVDLDDGMAQLVATIGAVEASAIKDRLTRIAHQVRQKRGADDTETEARTSAQIQADAFTELLLTGAGTDLGTGTGDALGAITGRVQVSVPVLTLAGAAHSAESAPYLGAAELAGYGPIDTLTARRLAGHASHWDRVLTHPVAGAVLAVDRYRPGEDLRRLLGARDQHCRFPGCTRRLDHCDVDHTVPAARGGPTELSNLAHLCRKHHTLKHFEFLAGSAWRPRPSPGGVLEWCSPTGRRYVDTPTSTVRFAPVAPVAPVAVPAAAGPMVEEPAEAAIGTATEAAA
ncbi:HNH endonuclease signature motif containing protein [Leucobacter celer]|uniref:HNH endonuclease signature motif containing protein n=1 Tax=Leucobacter celer TaxID=668625 RepID=UPI0006A79BF3|nr:HNH endonuclease signature motif containing protein [Leucobacter celer]